MDLKQLVSSLEQIAEEKNIPYETVLETVETALAAAYKKEYGDRHQHIRAEFNPDTGAMKMFQVFLIVDETMIRDLEEELGEEEENKTWDGEGEDKKVRFNPQRHMMLDEAKKIKKTVELEEELLVPLDPPKDFGRIAAQTAKQVIIQRLREAERDSVFEEFKEKEDEVVSGAVQRVEGHTVFVDIGRAIGVLYPDEQIQAERYKIGDRFRVYIARVERGTRGASIVLSRTHDKLVSRLFAIEVPEVSAGTVEIKSIAREPGSRSKVAVWTEEEGVDPVGSLVGQKGTRVQTVISELGGEKIDIIEWDPDDATFIAQALSPARVLYVDLDPDFRSSIAVVADDQLSLAIGQRGQNVRLAAKLTGWRIDIKTEEEMNDVVERRKSELRGIDDDKDASIEELPGVGVKTARALAGAGFDSIESIAKATVDELSGVEGIGKATAKKILAAAQEYSGSSPEKDVGDETDEKARLPIEETPEEREKDAIEENLERTSVESQKDDE